MINFYKTKKNTKIVIVLCFIINSGAENATKNEFDTNLNTEDFSQPPTILETTTINNSLITISNQILNENPNTTNLVTINEINNNLTTIKSEVISNSTSLTSPLDSGNSKNSATTSTNFLSTEIIKEDTNCPPITEGNVDNLTNEQFISKLTDACRYDKLRKPSTIHPLPVYMQVDMRHIESSDQLQFLTHMFVQYRYKDNRLKFDEISPNRGVIVGEELLRNKIWVPHTIVRNEKSTMIMGIDGKDVFVSISPEGDVVYSYRMTANFYCWMNLQKFPFDSQICDLNWSSWTYNATNLVLHWEDDNSVKLASNLHLTEFVIAGTWTEETEVEASFNKGAFAGNYSVLVFRFKLSREVGYYIMDYFLPSILLVCMSWVTFWLQADASPPRITLGTSTMLAFITLNGGLTKNLPKVSYIKASEIWFLTCACFIFCSIAEFAFVNIIWRRKKKVELKKQSSKHILKGALTPSLARKQLRKAESMNSLYKAHSCSSLDKENEKKYTQSNYLTVHSFPSTLNVPKITTQSQDDLILDDNEGSITTTIPIPETNNKSENNPAWQTMTPQEVAIWIDKKSRIVFPLAFLIFNIFYWTFVYVL